MPDGLEEIVEEYRTDEAARKERFRRQAKENIKKRKVRNIGIFIGAICLLFIVMYAANYIIMSKREIYASEEAMRTDMEGYWTCFDDSGSAWLQLVINGDEGTTSLRNLGSDPESEIVWHPQDGKFIYVNKEYVVNKGGKSITDGSYVYNKSSKLLTDYTDTSTPTDLYSSSESGYLVLKITTDSITSNSSYTICTGSVKNTGKKTYKFIEVKGSFEDISGNVIDTDWTYAAGSEGLAPGESTTFRLSVPYNRNIKSCSVRILEFN